MLEEWIDWISSHYALEALQAELDAAGVTDPAERERARQCLVKALIEQRAARESVGAVKH